MSMSFSSWRCLSYFRQYSHYRKFPRIGAYLHTSLTCYSYKLENRTTPLHQAFQQAHERLPRVFELLAFFKGWEQCTWNLLGCLPLHCCKGMMGHYFDGKTRKITRGYKESTSVVSFDAFQTVERLQPCLRDRSCVGKPLRDTDLLTYFTPAERK